MPRAILDTATYIDLHRARKFRTQSWAINTMKRAAAYRVKVGKLCLSPLVIMEITHGFREELRDQQLTNFRTSVLPMFEIVSFGIQEACLAGEIYAKLESKRQRIGIADTAIAATALLHADTVVTSNTKHFERVIDLGYSLTLENWREG